MSLSINNSPFAKVGTTLLEQSSSVTPKIGVNPSPGTSNNNTSPTLLRHDNSRAPQGEAMLTSAAFAKLFDMLDMVFRAMREMLSGRAMNADLSPDKTKLPGSKPEAREQPVKPDVGKQPVRPGTPGLPVNPQPADPRTVRLDGRKPDSLQVMPATPKPEVSVTNDAKANVQVNVSLSHCHCPDTKGRHTVDVFPRPDAIPTPKAQVLPTLKSEVTPQPTPSVTPDIKPTPRPDTPVTDLTSPGPADNRFDPRDWRFSPRPKFKS